MSLDLFVNDSNRHADVILPVDGFAEVEGTVTNLEGRVQKVNRLVSGVGGSRPAVEVLDDLATRLGGSIGAGAAAVAKEIAAVAPLYAAMSWESLDWGKGRDGIVVGGGFTDSPADSFTETAPQGFALHLAPVLYDDGTLMTVSESLSPLAPEPAAHLHPDDATRLGVAAGATVTVTGNAGTETLPVRLDPTLAPGTVYVPLVGVTLGNAVDVTVVKA